MQIFLLVNTCRQDLDKWRIQQPSMHPESQPSLQLPSPPPKGGSPRPQPHLSQIPWSPQPLTPQARRPTVPHPLA